MGIVKEEMESKIGTALTGLDRLDHTRMEWNQFSDVASRQRFSNDGRETTRARWQPSYSNIEYFTVPYIKLQLLIICIPYEVNLRLNM